MAGIAGTWLVWPVFKPVRNVDVSIPVYIPVQYIPADTIGIGMVLTTLPVMANLIWLVRGGSRIFVQGVKKKYKFYKR